MPPEPLFGSVGGLVRQHCLPRFGTEALGREVKVGRPADWGGSRSSFSLALAVLASGAESINNEIERSLYIKRASGKGWQRQMVDLLGYARLVNDITLARCRAREPMNAVA